MLTKNKRTGNSSLWLAVLSVPVAGLTSHGLAQTTANYTVDASASYQVGASASTNYADYINMEGPSNTSPDYAVYDLPTNTGGIPNGAVTSVNPSFTAEIADQYYSGQSTAPATFSFFLATDTTDSESSLRYESPGDEYTYTGGAAASSNGLNGVGETGSFPSGSLYYLGSGTFTPQTTDGAYDTFNLSIPSAAQSYVNSQVKAGGDLRVVVTTTDTADNVYESTYGYGDGYPPLINLSVTSSTFNANNSLIYAVDPNTSADENTVAVNFGTVVAGGAVSQSLTLGNKSGSNGSAFILVNQNQNEPMDNSFPPSGASNPIAPGGTATASVGFSNADTTGIPAGTNLTGQMTFTNGNDAGDQGVTVNGAAHIVVQRELDAGASYATASNNMTSPVNVGKVLVGSTASVTTTLSTVNPALAGTDYGPDVTTTETLQAGSQATAYTQKDPFSAVGVATLNASAPTTIVFNGTTNSGQVVGSVTPLVSGIYGDDHATTFNGVSHYYDGDYVGFPVATPTVLGIVGQNLPGESDYANVYLQWQGYQTASVTANNGSPLTAGSQAILTNAATNDNILTSTMGTLNQGLRAGAYVGSIAINQSSQWSQTGLTPTVYNTTAGASYGTYISGTEISGSQEAGDTNSYNATADMVFNTANAINGTYGASMAVVLENEQDIQGSAANDLGTTTFNLTYTMSSNPSVQSGTYLLNGGTLSAPATDLTGSYTQSGGTATFSSLKLDTSATATFSGGSLTVGSLTITGSSVLNITNGHMFIDYGSGSDPMSTIYGYLKSGFNGGGWNGPGIISSNARTLNNGLKYGVGFSDGNDKIAGHSIVTGLSSGQIELKYTLLGDANLDGTVNGSDFSILAANFGQGYSNWDQGNFLYTPAVNGTDFGALAANFGQGDSGADSVVSAADVAALVAFAQANGLPMSDLASVPEPASIGLLSAGAVSLMVRRRRRQQ